MNVNLATVIRLSHDGWTHRPEQSTVASAQREFEKLVNDQKRLHLAKEALVKTGYFTADQVDDDVAPRIIEMHSALSREKPMDAINRMLLVEPAKDQFTKDFERLLEAARAFRNAMDKFSFLAANRELFEALKPFDIPGAKKTCATCGHTL